MTPRIRRVVALLCGSFVAAPLVAQEVTPPLGPLPVVSADPDGGVGPAGSVFYSTSPGVGASGDFTSIEGMIPFLQVPGRSLFFTDLRGLLSERGVVGANLGGGYRVIDDLDRLFGVNVYYDNRDTGRSTFHQVAAGFESLGRFLDVRGNVYVPVGNRRRVVDDFFTDGGTTSTTTADIANGFFRGHNIIFNEVTTFSQLLHHVRNAEAAMTGFDLECGTPVPGLGRWLKAYAGMYNFQSSQGDQTWGARGRLEARINDGLIMNFSVQNDRIFDTTAMFQVGIRFGGGAWRRRPDDNIADRLLDHVQRNYGVVVHEQQTVTPVVTNSTSRGEVVAIDPATNLPVVVDHVASGAAAGGDGTFEHPFQTLVQLQAGSQTKDILFAWANSTFTNQAITLKADQRFLGEGITHLLPSQFGTAVLPRATAGAVAPLITAGEGVRVTLANGTEVAGFTFEKVTNSAVSGLNVTGVTIDRNTMTSTGAPDRGTIDLTYNVAGTYTAIVSGNTIRFDNGTAIRVSATAGSIQLTVDNSTITDGSGEGVAITAFGPARMALSMTGNTVSANGGTGISLLRDSGTGLSAEFTATLTGNTVRNNGLQGIDVLDQASSTFPPTSFRADLFNNVTSGNAGAGIRLDCNSFFNSAADMLSHTVGNTMTGDNVAGIDGGGFQAEAFSAAFGASKMALLLGNNSSLPANGAGYNLVHVNAGTLPSTFLFQDAGGNVGTFSTTGTITPGTVPP